MKKRFNSDRLKLELSRSRRPAMWYVYLIGVGIFALTISLNNQFYDKPWQPKYKFSASFRDAKGFTPGIQRVKIAGITVGIVTGAKVKDGRAVLELQVLKKYGHIFKDARIRLRPLTPMQDMFVSIDSRGHKSAGALGSGDVLPGSRTVSPVDISRVMDEFPTATRERMQVLLNQFGRGLKDNGAQLKAAFGELSPFLTAAQRTTTVIQQRRKGMAHLITNLSTLTAALAARDHTLTTLVDKGNLTLGELSGADTQLDATLREIPPTLDVLREAFAGLRTAEDQLDPALTDLKPVAAGLSAGMSALRQFSTDATPALVAVRPAVTRLAPLARDLKPTAAALSDAFSELRLQAPAYDRLTAQLPPCFDTISHFFNDTLSVFKFADASGTYPRGNDSQDLDTLGGVAPAAATNQTRSPNCTDGKP